MVVADLNGADHPGQAPIAPLCAVFAEFPENKAELLNRIAVGRHVIDHEQVDPRPGGDTFEVIAIYTLADGKIARVDFAK